MFITGLILNICVYPHSPSILLSQESAGANSGGPKHFSCRSSRRNLRAIHNTFPTPFLPFVLLTIPHAPHKGHLRHVALFGFLHISQSATSSSTLPHVLQEQGVGIVHLSPAFFPYITLCL